MCAAFFRLQLTTNKSERLRLFTLICEPASEDRGESAKSSQNSREGGSGPAPPRGAKRLFTLKKLVEREGLEPSTPAL